jgi:hypothetical protein
MECLTVGAPNGQATNLSPDGLRTAARIVSVEARHAGWIRAILGKAPSPNPADRGLTEAQVLTAITATGPRNRGDDHDRSCDIDRSFPVRVRARAV